MVNFKITVGDNDISEYVVSEGNINTLTLDPISSGKFFVSTECPFSITNFDEIKFYLRVTSFVHLFTGIITNVQLNEEKNYYVINLANTSYRYLKKAATNKFRDDVGTGGAIYIVKALNDEYVPEISYNSSTIPTDTYTFIEQAYQSKYINEIYDRIADLLGRQWWVDKDKLLNMKTRTFTTVSSEITADDIIDNVFTVDYDVSKMANSVIVDGAKISKTITQTENVAGGSTEFDLDYVPNSSLRVLVPSGGTEQSVALEGTENYDTSYDCYVKVADRKLKFKTTPGGSTIDIIYDVFSAVHDERQDGASINSEGITVEKVITEENITSQDDAFNLAQNYLDNYSLPLSIITCDVQITTQAQISDWQIGKRVKVTKGNIDSYYNLVGVTYFFGINSNKLRLRFTDFPETEQDLLKQLILKVKQREERERKSSTDVTKYFFWGGNIYLEVENVHVWEETWDTSSATGFILGHADKGVLGTDKLGIPNQTGTTELSVINSSKGFVDRFLQDEHWIDEANSDVVYNLSGSTRGYIFSSGSVYQSNIIEKNGNIYNQSWYELFVDGTFTVDLSDDADKDSASTAYWDTTNERLCMSSSSNKSKVYNTFIRVNQYVITSGTFVKATFSCDEHLWGNDEALYYLTSDGENWEEVQEGVEHSFTDQGGILGFMTVFIGNGAIDSYIDNVKINFEKE